MRRPVVLAVHGAAMARGRTHPARQQPAVGRDGHAGAHVWRHASECTCVACLGGSAVVDVEEMGAESQLDTEVDTDSWLRGSQAFTEPLETEEPEVFLTVRDDEPQNCASRAMQRGGVHAPVLIRDLPAPLPVGSDVTSLSRWQWVRSWFARLDWNELGRTRIAPSVHSSPCPAHTLQGPFKELLTQAVRVHRTCAAPTPSSISAVVACWSQRRRPCRELGGETTVQKHHCWPRRGGTARRAGA